MCCTVTATNLILPLLAAALIALAIMAGRSRRFRTWAAAGWALAPVWAGCFIAGTGVTTGHSADGLFVAVFFVAIFQLPWAAAVGIGLLTGITLRWALKRDRGRRSGYVEQPDSPWGRS